MNAARSPSSFSNSKIPLILLKTRSQPDDSYEDLFSDSASNYAPTFVPVLQHKPNLDSLNRLRDLLARGCFGGDEPHYGGLIFTSQRAVEAFASVVQELEADPEKRLRFHTSIPLYTVGPATSRSLRSLVTHSKALTKAPILGAETGNGEKLAQYILGHYISITLSTAGVKRPLLFLVGEQRRDVIPRTLMSPDLPAEKRIQVDELTVYQTDVMESFPIDFRNVLDTISTNPIACVVVFSPAGCEATLRCLGYIDNNANLTDDGSRRWTGHQSRQFCIATIGPTTRDHLTARFAFEPDVCSKNPSPEGIMDGLNEFLGAKGIL